MHPGLFDSARPGARTAATELVSVERRWRSPRNGAAPACIPPSLQAHHGPTGTSPVVAGDRRIEWPWPCTKAVASSGKQPGGQRAAGWGMARTLRARKVGHNARGARVRYHVAVTESGQARRRVPLRFQRRICHDRLQGGTRARFACGNDGFGDPVHRRFNAPGTSPAVAGNGLSRRIRAVRILAGGSPRLLSILSHFVSRLSFPGLVQDIAGLVVVAAGRAEHASHPRCGLLATRGAERRCGSGRRWRGGS